jgi:hypothetical protein
MRPAGAIAELLALGDIRVRVDEVSMFDEVGAALDARVPGGSF